MVGGGGGRLLTIPLKRGGLIRGRGLFERGD